MDIRSQLPDGTPGAPASLPAICENHDSPAKMPALPAPSSTETTRQAFRFRKRYVAALVMLCVLVFCCIGVAGYFRLSSETRMLRGALMGSVAGQWDQQFAVHLGSFTLGLVRIGSQLVRLPPEPRAALEALRGVEVGVYQLHQERAAVDPKALLQATDKAMAGRGWERVVGVVKEGQVVGVYVARQEVSPSPMACCLMVFQDRNLVVASVRGNPEPLWELAAKRLDRRHRDRDGETQARRIAVGVASFQ